MKEKGWIKDQNPYLVFTCSKCKNYQYVKTTQMRKKCLRCGRSQSVDTIFEAETVKGMSNAVKLVITRQNELAIKELGSTPDFRTPDDFKISGITTFEKQIQTGDGFDEFITKFEAALIDIKNLYTVFPYYVLEMITEQYQIPRSELKLLLARTVQKGKLSKTKNGMYTFSPD
jgi:hypothetical protein